ncbi:hypothetical protein, partial [uncultured Porphyromonas sp.]|uniref:hypothetical protein n=1 Tax=uncultured Porphyromonas sp. TaxID=159274 RepID=UPI002602B32D
EEIGCDCAKQSHPIRFYSRSRSQSRSQSLRAKILPADPRASLRASVAFIPLTTFLSPPIAFC